MVIVDNDPEGSASETVAALTEELSMPLFYGVEKTPGIPFARNKTLDLAAGIADDVIFLDDDEVPDDGWLEELLRVRDAYQADVVTGAVNPVFAEDPPRWMVEGGFLQYTRHQTGKDLDRAYTNNTMVPWSLIENSKIRFDENMAQTGGSDTHFFRRLHQQGAKIVWANEAVVSELIPTTRSDSKWILQRAFRIGNSSAYIERDLFPWTKSIVTMVAGGAYRIVKGLISWPLGWFGGRSVRVHALRQVYYGLGMISGWLGFRYNEYRTIHGR
ncbi:MAG: succinoglycan biosynthesis protein ExoM [Planctomycetota bacterium]|jgi:succinoglycan biosynthesis protein ExoM